MVCSPPESDQKSTPNTNSLLPVFWSSLWNKFNCTGGYEQRIQFGKVVSLVVLLASYRRADIQKLFPAVCNNTKKIWANNTQKKQNNAKLLRSQKQSCWPHLLVIFLHKDQGILPKSKPLDCRSAQLPHSLIESFLTQTRKILHGLFLVLQTSLRFNIKGLL